MTVSPTAISISRRRDCHFADAPSQSLLKRLPQGERDAAE